jgi:demethoxyubiquinone hydroxylase (CLK1/Coq7/Cat5 family)
MSWVLTPQRQDLRPLDRAARSHSLYRRMASSGMLRRVALVRTDLSEEFSASLIRVTRLGELSSQRASVSRYG